MKSIGERENFVFALAQVILIGISSSQFKGCFDSLRTTIAEEGFFQARNFNQPFGQQSLIRMIKEVTDMDRLLNLFSNNIVNALVVVSQRIDRDARQKVDIALTGIIVNHAFPPLVYEKGIFLIVADEVFGFRVRDLFQVHADSSN